MEVLILRALPMVIFVFLKKLYSERKRFGATAHRYTKHVKAKVLFSLGYLTLMIVNMWDAFVYCSVSSIKRNKIQEIK